MTSLSALDMNPADLKEVCALLHRHVPGSEVWAFGSRAKGKARPYSDLDLMLVEKEPLSFSALAELKESFLESGLPYKVDVLEWASTAPAFRKIIEAEKILLLAAA